MSSTDESLTSRALRPRTGKPTSEPPWEQWVDVTFTWLPYLTLAACVVVAQIGMRTASDRLVSIGLTAVAAAWTWGTFTRRGKPTHLPQSTVRVYFVGFVVVAASLTLSDPIFLAYGITGFFHASLLRPWWLMFAGIGATAMVVQSTIVYPGGTNVDWLIYLGVVTIQTAAVGAGIYAGVRVMDIADERRETLERLESAMEENVGLHDQLIAQAREAGVLDERQRLAREIHDTIAQGLTGVITQLEAANHSWNDQPEMHRHIDNASRLARESLSEARRSVQAIRPTELELTRLPEALKDVASRWSDMNDLDADVYVTGMRRRLRPEVEVTLLRVAQEGLANVGKHADATRVGMTLSFMDDSVVLDVRDDGVGFDSAAPVKATSFGLASMRQRVHNVHGDLTIESAAGDGTAVSVRIPTSSDGPSDA